MSSSPARVAVIGLGYIGLPTAVALATRGVEVVGVDVNADTVEAVSQGEVPFVEPDLAVGVSGAVAMGRLDGHHRDPGGRRLHHRGADAVQRRPRGRPELRARRRSSRSRRSCAAARSSSSSRPRPRAPPSR